LCNLGFCVWVDDIPVGLTKGITAYCSRARERGTISQWQADEAHEEARRKERA